MCVATIGKVIEIKKNRGLCSFRGALKEVSLALVPTAELGSYVVVHAGFATEVISDLGLYYQSTVTTDGYSRQLLDAIESISNQLGYRPLKLMNFCGSHEHTINQFGLKGLLPGNIRLISGPGCPVCVTPENEIYLGIEALREHDVILTIYNDMLNIPTPWGSLGDFKAEGADVRLVNDINEALQIARQETKEVVHMAVGFETTAPSTGATIQDAEGQSNFSVISSHRLTSPAMEYVMKHSSVDGIICPGNVAMVTGLEPFQTVNEKYKLPLVITGFEPIDLLEGILKLVRQVKEGAALVENQYTRVVSQEGNLIAKDILEEVFEKAAVAWRGLPMLADSRLVLKDKYKGFDAEHKFDLKGPGLESPTHHLESQKDCCCGEILRGDKGPKDCPSFGKNCTPDIPKGPCMITSEGACRIQYITNR